MSRTSIEWTDETWNPFRGCTRVSPGCDNCYAISMAHRFAWGDGLTRIRKKDGKVDWSGQVRLIESEISRPLTWRKPRRAFVCSGSDLFHEQIPFADIFKVFFVMALAEASTFQCLTKRPHRAAAFVRWMSLNRVLLPGGGWPLPNVWLGVSAEDQQRWDERVPALVRIPAAVRFVSAEPLLGPIDIGDVGCAGLDWLIVGGESGPGARPLEFDWVENLIEQCSLCRIACFVKQLGARPENRGAPFTPRLTGKGGNMDEWPPDLRIREWPPDRSG